MSADCARHLFVRDGVAAWLECNNYGDDEVKEGAELESLSYDDVHSPTKPFTGSAVTEVSREPKCGKGEWLIRNRLCREAL